MIKQGDNWELTLDLVSNMEAVDLVIIKPWWTGACEIEVKVGGG